MMTGRFSFTPCSRAISCNFLKQGGLSADYKINRALPLLFEVLGISVLAIAVVLAFPPLLLGERLAGRNQACDGFLLYFVCIGAGYILIQVALDPKIYTLSGPSNVCTNGDHFFDAHFERPGQLL